MNVVWWWTIAGIVLAVCWRKFYWYQVCYHFQTVVPGRIYRSGALSYRGLCVVYRRHSIHTIISLISMAEAEQSKEHQAEIAFCQQHGIRRVHIPVQPGTIPTTAELQQFLLLLADPRNQPVLVHCKQGVARTNMMLAAFYKDHLGWDNATIFKKLPWFKHDYRKPRYDKIRQFILTYGTSSPV